MEFYKMFCIIHRRTDWKRLYEWQRECIVPEYYEEKRKMAEESLYRLMLSTHLIRSVCNK